MDPKVEAYIRRSTRWPTELQRIRELLLESGLTERIAWGKPCFSHEGDNIAILQEMKPFLAVMFFKGALLHDPHGMLTSQGEHSRSAMRLEFTSVDQIDAAASAIADLVADAIDKRGATVGPAPDLVLVDELRERLANDDTLREAFESLTPGRQREYHLFVSAAKQSSTRQARVDKHIDRILARKGLRD